MSLAVFNINDAGIQVALDGEIVRTSPGYAVLDGDTLMTGEKASTNARLFPRWANNRFWSELSTNPLGNGTQQIRHHADLAFAHLEDLWQSISDRATQVIFVVPAYYDNQTLGLLLGMAKECNLPVSGVVDNSVLVASNLPLRPTVLHLDIHLHAITLTRISNAGTLIRKDVKTVLETGLFKLWDRWANIIANQFIQSTRFDPMHDAMSEQQMFDLLPDWISSLDSAGMHSFQLSMDETEHSVVVSHENLLKACTPLYPQIVQAIRSEIPPGETASVLLSHRFCGFPGLLDSLGLITNLELQEISELKSVGSATLHKDEIIKDNGSVSHILQLSTGEVSENPSAAEYRIATHILFDGHALPIGSGFKLNGDLSAGLHASSEPVCTIYPSGNQLLLERHAEGTLTINGVPARQSQSVSAGDTLEVDGQQVQLITVSNHG